MLGKFGDRIPPANPSGVRALAYRFPSTDSMFYVNICIKTTLSVNKYLFVRSRQKYINANNKKVNSNNAENTAFFASKIA